MVAAVREALGQVPAGALGVAGAEARLEQRVVEDVALGAAAAELDDAGPYRLQPPIVLAGTALGERLQAPDPRDPHVAHEAGEILRCPRACRVDLLLRRRPVARVRAC